MSPRLQSQASLAALAGLAGLALVSAARSSDPAPDAAPRTGPAATTDSGAGSGTSSPRPDAARPSAAVACPEEMALAAGVCIDRWEAHLVRLVDGGDEPHPPFDRPRSGMRYAARARGGVVPQGYLSRHEAAAACAASGKRLCRAREWYRACSNGGTTRFPHGDGRGQATCNLGKAHLLTRLFGTVHMTYEAHYNSPRLNREPGFLAETGAHAGCRTEAGVFDMVGNLHEWVADDVSGQLARDLPLDYGADKLGSEGDGVFMGGYFSSHGEHGTGCVYTTATHAPDYHDYSTGFRCCADPR